MSAIRESTASNYTNVSQRELAQEIKKGGVEKAKRRYDNATDELTMLKEKLANEKDSLSPREKKKISSRIRQIEKFIRNIVSAITAQLKQITPEWLMGRSKEPVKAQS